MTVQLITDNTNKPFYLGGSPVVRGQETLAQDGSRAAVLAPYTVLAKNSAGKWAPLADVDVVQTAAYMTCGAIAGNLAAWQAIDAGEFSITVDGEVLNVTGLNFTGITALGQIVNVINASATLTGKVVCVDTTGLGGPFRFVSASKGLGRSSVTALSAVSGGTGDNISGGTVGLNGLSGTVVAATGDIYTTIPAGIYVGSEIAAATLVAGDVTKKQVLVGGFPAYVDKNQLVFENSQALTSVIKVNGLAVTVEDHLFNNLGIIAIDSVAMDAQEND
jgi:hypothetical protein